MKFRLISKSGEGLALLKRIADEGHDCDFWLKSKRADSLYRGILPRQDTYTASLTKDMVLIFDTVGMGAIADGLKSSGFKVFGAGRVNDALELDCEFAAKVARASGLKMLESDEQTKEFPVEITTWAWYVGGELVPNTIGSSLVQKRFMNADLGPIVDCAGAIAWFWPEKKPNKWAKRMSPTTATIYRLTLKKLESFLRTFRYSGLLSIDTAISKKDKLPYFIRFRSKLAYPIIYAMAEGLDVPLSELFSDLAEGKVPDIKPSYDYLGMVTLSVPPYPSWQGVEQSANKPINTNGDHCWLVDAKRHDDRLMTAGTTGVVCEVTGRDEDLNKLGRTLRAAVDNLKIPDKQARTDLVDTIKPKLNFLRAWNFF